MRQYGHAASSARWQFSCGQGCFQNELSELVNCSSYSIEGVAEGPGGEEGPDAVVKARVRDSTGGREVLVEFRLRRRRFGSKKGAFMTSMLKKVVAA